MAENLIEYFSRKFGGHIIPPDFFALILREEEKAFGRPGPDPVGMCGAELLGPDRSHPLISHDYINDRDRADPDVMDNVNAMNDTAQHFVFAAAISEGVLGYWLKDSPENPPIFLLDTEGQYQIADGETLAQCLSYRFILGRDNAGFEKAAQAFKRYDINLDKKTEDEIFAGMDARKAATVQTPQKFRSERYNCYREKRGAPPIG